MEIESAKVLKVTKVGHGMLWRLQSGSWDALEVAKWVRKRSGSRKVGHKDAMKVTKWVIRCYT